MTQYTPCEYSERVGDSGLTKCLGDSYCEYRKPFHNGKNVYCWKERSFQLAEERAKLRKLEIQRAILGFGKI